MNFVLLFIIFVFGESIGLANIFTAYLEEDIYMSWTKKPKTAADYNYNCKWGIVCLISTLVVTACVPISPLLTPGWYWWPLWIATPFGIYITIRLFTNKPEKKIDVLKSQNGLSKS